MRILQMVLIVMIGLYNHAQAGGCGTTSVDYVKTEQGVEVKMKSKKDSAEEVFEDKDGSLITFLTATKILAENAKDVELNLEKEKEKCVQTEDKKSDEFDFFSYDPNIKPNHPEFERILNKCGVNYQVEWKKAFKGKSLKVSKDLKDLVEGAEELNADYVEKEIADKQRTNTLSPNALEVYKGSLLKKQAKLRGLKEMLKSSNSKMEDLETWASDFTLPNSVKMLGKKSHPNKTPASILKDEDMPVPLKEKDIQAFRPSRGKCSFDLNIDQLKGFKWKENQGKGFRTAAGGDQNEDDGDAISSTVAPK